MDETKRAPRVPLNFRISQDAIDHFDAMAAAYGLDRATVIRAHLAVGRRHADKVRDILAGLVEARN